MISEKSPTPETELPKWRFAQKEFSTEAEAVAFVKLFWENVDSRTSERIQLATKAAELREQTVLDRTVLNGYGNSFTVSIYRNHNTEPLTKKAIEFLRQQGIQGSE